MGKGHGRKGKGVIALPYNFFMKAEGASNYKGKGVYAPILQSIEPLGKPFGIKACSFFLQAHYKVAFLDCFSKGLSLLLLYLGYISRLCANALGNIFYLLYFKRDKGAKTPFIIFNSFFYEGCFCFSNPYELNLDHGI